jgi:hypothetical protein
MLPDLHPVVYLRCGGLSERKSGLIGMAHNMLAL